MVLRLVSGPMLEKSNRAGPLTDRQKVLLTARSRVSFFSDFQLPGKRKIFKKFSRELREVPGIPKIVGITGIQEIFESFRGKIFRA